ncbi:MAG TPA: hypothetical protein VFB62_24170 [Polyangiaceae bacterium]|nr:hypothetical protein [Polyangiaceae bacterium]
MKRIVFSIALAAIACDETPKPGGQCQMAQEGDLLGCESASAALRCRDLRLEPVGCKGPKGCTPAGDRGANCDRSVAGEGDVCWETADEEIACTSDARTLRCAGGRFAAVRSCRGPKGCNALGADYKGERCDQSVAKAGDPCERSGFWKEACSVDRKTILDCREAPKKGKPDGEFKAASECPVQKGCELHALVGETERHYPLCDFRGSKEGDRCGTGNQNTRICSPDQGAILACDDTSLTFVAEPCPKGTHCEGVSKDPKRVNDTVTCTPTPTPR